MARKKSSAASGAPQSSVEDSGDLELRLRGLVEEHARAARADMNFWMRLIAGSLWVLILVFSAILIRLLY